MKTKMLNRKPNSMTTIMENFKKYQQVVQAEYGSSDDVVYLFENNQKVPSVTRFDTLVEQNNNGELSDQQFIKIWEESVDYEVKEIERLYAQYLLQEQDEEVEVAAEKEETVEAPGWLRKIGQMFNKLLEQAWKLIQTIGRAGKKVVSVLSGILKFLNKFCDKHPIMCKAGKILLIMLIVIALMIVFSSEAEAAIDASNVEGAGYVGVLDDRTVNALKAVLAKVSEGENMSTEDLQAAVDAFDWMEKAHASDTLIDLANAEGEAPAILEAMLKQTVKIANEGGKYDAEWVQYLSRLGEKVVVMSHEVSRTVIGGAKGYEHINLEWESLEFSP
tara:strand:+ start:1805 stop:2800 length:996 start_codon:yes stop_codon:yes gene_type:complete